MQKYHESVLNMTGTPADGVSVLVSLFNGGVATIYSDNGVTEASNPLTTNSLGYFEFYAADGRYTLTISGPGIETINITDVLLEDPQDGSAMVIDGGTIANSALSNITIDGVAVAGSDIAKYSRLNDADGSSLVGFIQSGSGTLANTVEGKLRLRCDVEDFGAIGDGTLHTLSERFSTLAAAQAVYPHVTALTDSIDWAAIQAAINSGVKNIRFTQNEYVTNKTLGGTRQNVGFVGDAAGGFQVTIRLVDATGLLDIFAFSDGVNTLNSYHFSNLTFTRSDVATDGAAVNMSRCGAVKFTRCAFYGQNRLFRALKLFRTIDVTLEHCTGSGMVGDMIDWAGNNGSDRAIDLSVMGGRYEGGASTFIKVNDYCEGLFIKGAILFNFGAKIVDVATTGANTFDVCKIQNCDIDTSTNYGIYALRMRNALLTGNWYSNVQNGLYLRDCTEVVIAGGGINFGLAVGIEIDGGSDITIGSQTLAAASTAGLKFSASTAAAARVSLVGNRIRNNTVGVAWGATPPTTVTFVGNTLTSNAADFSGTVPTTNYVGSVNNISGQGLNYAELHKWYVDNTEYGSLTSSGSWLFGPATADYVRLGFTTGNVDILSEGSSAAVALNLKAKGATSINGYIQAGADLIFQALRGAGSAGDSYAEFRAGSTNVRFAAQGNATNLDIQVIPKGTGVLASVGAVSVTTAGKGLLVKEGSNAKQGTATLVAGSSVVSNTSVTANSRIFLTSQADGGTPGFLRVSARSAGVSFTITSSSGTDTSTVAYQIFEPA